MSRAAAAALAAALAAGCGGGRAGVVPVSLPEALRPPPDAVLDQPDFDELGEADQLAPATPVADQYREVAARIAAAARADHAAYDKLAQLTDRIGHRLSGSAELEQAIGWAVVTMRADGHQVRTEDVMVPHWVRGAESARLVAPVRRELVVLGLGGTVGTPRRGLTAPVVVVRSWAELKQRAAEIKGSIVLYDVAMPAWTEEHGSGYGTAVPFRWAGADQASRVGAVAVLVRSLTGRSLRSPHTGGLGYGGEVPRIPAAAVTTEDADLIVRLAAAGKVVVHLELGARTLADARSANVIAELRGREHPEQVVVIGAHLDSWDVGQGAHDDGAGCVHVMQALTVLRQLGLTPRRTIRVVLFTNEENGLRGGKAYAADHAAELGDHVAAIESDSGGFEPRSFEVVVGDDQREAVLAALTEVAGLLAPESTITVEVADHGAGADIGPMVKRGVLGVGLQTDGRTYFDIHHTQADTLDKVDPVALANGVAAIAVLAYVLADLPEPLHVTPAEAPTPAAP